MGRVRVVARLTASARNARDDDPTAHALYAVEDRPDEDHEGEREEVHDELHVRRVRRAEVVACA